MFVGSPMPRLGCLRLAHLTRASTHQDKSGIATGEIERVEILSFELRAAGLDFAFCIEDSVAAVSCCRMSLVRETQPDDDRGAASPALAERIAPKTD